MVFVFFIIFFAYYLFKKEKCLFFEIVLSKIIDMFFVDVVSTIKFEYKGSLQRTDCNVCEMSLF